MPELPPFRADQVGSLLRPARACAMRARHKHGELDAATLREVEDRRDPRSGARSRRRSACKSITDGEFRRDWWHLDFLSQLDGVTLQAQPGAEVQGGRPRSSRRSPSVTGQVGCSQADHGRRFHVPEVQHHSSTREDDDPVALDAAPARRPRGDLDKAVYPDLDEFWADVAAAYREAIAHLARRRLPLPAARRRHVRLPVRPEDPGQLPQQRRRSGRAAAHLRRHDQRRARRQARRT